MYILSLLVCAAAALKAPSTVPKEFGQYTVTRLPKSRTRPAAPLSELKVTSNVINLTRADSGATSLSSTFVRAMRQNAKSRVARPDAQTGTTPLLSVESGQVFLADVVVGGQQFSVVIDTGSSDPWLAITGYSCFDPIDDTPLDEEECELASAYDSTDNSTGTSAFRPIGNQNFNITYADGEYLTGTFGYETFQMAGITVKNQQFGLVDQAAWYGDGISSGLVGFAYRTLTSAYAGTDPTADKKGKTVLYNPLFVNMYQNEGVPPVFSMAIDRDQSVGGIMGIGGIPDIPHSPYWVSTEIQPVSVNGTSGDPVYEFYSIDTYGFAISNSTSTQFNVYANNNTQKTPLIANGTDVIVDSGTSLCYVPNRVAQALAAAFNPPAYWDTTYEAYFLNSCDSVAPVFGVGIAGKIFYVNAEDMIIEVADNLCIMGVQPNNGGLNILGGTWMKNVIAVFDIGAEKMRFAARQFYSTAQ